MYDPLSIGMLTLGAAQDPETFSKMMASQGIAPPVGQGPGTVAPFMADAAMGALFAPQAGAPAGTGAGVPATAGASPLSALTGVKAPVAPQPQWSGGVSGGAPDPKLQLQQSQGSKQVQAMLAMLANQQQQQNSVPGLAQLLKGVG